MRIITLAVLTLAFLGTSCSRGLQRQYLFSLKSTAGLRENAAITFLGVKVGHIADVRLNTDGESAVATAYITNPEMRLRHGDTARVVIVGLLGDPEIEITRHSQAEPELDAGSRIAVSPEIPLSPEAKKQLHETIGTVLDTLKPHAQ